MRGPTGLEGHPELGCFLSAMEALGLVGARKALERQRGEPQGNLVCIWGKLVKVTTKWEGSISERK